MNDTKIMNINLNKEIHDSVKLCHFLIVGIKINEDYKKKFKSNKILKRKNKSNQH